MNCKPGDIVRVSHPQSVCYGAITRVLNLQPAGFGGWDEVHGPVWEIETPLLAFFMFSDLEVLCYPDIGLRPIRDPGEDAVDEMVKRCPVPLPEIVPAMLDRETV